MFLLIFRQQKNFGLNVVYYVLGTSIENQQMRIQEGHFLKIALNLVLTLPDDGECPALLISCGIIDLQHENNILVKNLDRFRILVPMPYISLACVTKVPRKVLAT